MTIFDIYERKCVGIRLINQMDQTIVVLALGSLTILTSFVIISILLIQKKIKRTKIWNDENSNVPMTSSAPISRRSSSSFLINMDKSSELHRSRSASFGEDLTSRLQMLNNGTCYQSYSPVKLKSFSFRSNRIGSSTNVRSSPAQNAPPQPTNPSISFQMRYESISSILFVNIFQLNHFLSNKSNQTVFMILYLLPNDDEQRQSQPSAQGIFNEQFQFPIKSMDIIERTLRLTAYIVDPTTRIRTILGHSFIKLDRFVKDDSLHSSFSTATLTEDLTMDLPMKMDQLGELVVTSCYLKDQNILQIKIQEIHQLKIDRSNTTKSLKAYFSGQTSHACHRYQWINTSTFLIPQSSTFRIDQELNLIARSPPFTPIRDEHVQCHLRLHLHQQTNQIHSHARWSHSLQTSSSHTVTVPLRTS